MFPFELTSGTTEIGVVGGDDNVVEEIETEEGDEGYLDKYETILTAVRPKILNGIHLFWFNDSTIGFLSERHAGMSAAIRLSSAQQAKAMRKSVGVKNIWKSKLGS